tara:strand:- start:53 stop:1708 length:1656 start_codon:yes stop_codon:yes gene_type:complete
MAELGQPLTLKSVRGPSGVGYTNNIASMMQSGDIINIRVNNTKTIKDIKPSKITVGNKTFTKNSVTGPKLLAAIKEHNDTKDVYFVASGGNHNLFGVNGIVKGTLMVDDKTMTPKEKKESKPDYPLKFNRGGINEGITGAALFLRFQNKNRADITETELFECVMKQMKPKGAGGKLLAPGENKGVKEAQKKKWKGKWAGKDDIHWVWGLKSEDATSMYDPDMWEFWKGKAHPKWGNKPENSDMIAGALAYVNGLGSNKPRPWADAMYDNGIYNKVVINAEGETGQTLTKVDIRVSVNNHDGVMEEVDILRISAKFAAVGQFGQYSKKNLWSTTAEIFDDWFGIKKPIFTQEKWDQELISLDQGFDTAVAIRSMWAEECGVVYDRDSRSFVGKSDVNNLTKALQTPSGAKAFKNILWRNLSQGKDSTEQEDGVTLVDNVKGDSQIYALDDLKLEEVFKDVDLKANIKVSRARDATKQDLLDVRIDMQHPDNPAKRLEVSTIRVKRGESLKDGPFYRTIFEKKKGLTEAIAAKASTQEAPVQGQLKALGFTPK